MAKKKQKLIKNKEEWDKLNEEEKKIFMPCGKIDHLYKKKCTRLHYF